MQNKALTDKIDDLKKEIENHKKIIRTNESLHKKALSEAKAMVDSVSREAQLKEKNLESKKMEVFKSEQDSARRLSEIADSNKKQESTIQANQRMIEEHKQDRANFERQLRNEFQGKLDAQRKELDKLTKENKSMSQ